MSRLLSLDVNMTVPDYRHIDGWNQRGCQLYRTRLVDYVSEFVQKISMCQLFNSTIRSNLRCNLLLF